MKNNCNPGIWVLWHLRALSESYSMNTHMPRQGSLHPCALDESSLSIGRVKESFMDEWVIIGLFKRMMLGKGFNMPPGTHSHNALTVS